MILNSLIQTSASTCVLSSTTHSLTSEGGENLYEAARREGKGSQVDEAFGTFQEHVSVQAKHLHEVCGQEARPARQLIEYTRLQSSMIVS